MLTAIVTLTLLASTAPITGERIVLVADGLNQPFGVTFDAAGNTYITETAGNRISVLDPDGSLRVFAGTGQRGLAGDDGPALEAQFNNPHHLLVGPDGYLYIADTLNNCVRRIDLETGIVTRVAGTGERGFSGDGGPALQARFGGIYALAFYAGRLYVCDLDNRRVRAIDLDSGIVTTVAGNGQRGVPTDGEDTLNQPLVDPRAIAIDSQGNLYICERNGHALRVVNPTGQIRTVAGTGQAGFSGDDGPALEARFRGPKHISVDGNDNVLIADTENHVIRVYSPKDEMIRRVAGTGERGSEGLGGPPTSCLLNRPHGVTVNPDTGAVYISDAENNRVLRIEN